MRISALVHFDTKIYLRALMEDEETERDIIKSELAREFGEEVMKHLSIKEDRFPITTRFSAQAIVISIDTFHKIGKILNEAHVDSNVLKEIKELLNP